VAGELSQPVVNAMTDTRSFYEVFGQRYHILDSADGYVEHGVASWYGPKFHGNVTASGERFDMYALTAAHRTLPISTDVEVTNLRNGKSIVVRINDGLFRSTHHRFVRSGQALSGRRNGLWRSARSSAAEGAPF
jgi:rare lipoprotein A (peptidoglycan hydrolase)